MTSRTVTVHAPRACAVQPAAYVEFRALGDFDSPPPPGGHRLGAAGEALPEIDGRARSLVASVTEGGRNWTGLASVPGAGGIDVLVLPSLASCALSASIDRRADAVLAPIAGARVLVVGGSGDPTPRTFVADLTTGAVSPVVRGLLRQRTRASVTAFGDGAVVAGGVGDDGTVLASAEVYDAALQGFDQQRSITLGQARADQGAVVLTSGETLLVGGVGTNGVTPLSSLEIVDPARRAVRTDGLTHLTTPRRAPTALRLASGEVLVAGGFDAGGTPVAELEWLAPDASRSTKRTLGLVTGAARAFAPLECGGALAVVAPVVLPPAGMPGFQNVWVIDADGALEAAVPIEGPLTAPVLFGGAGGAPVLWTGDRWLRWQPWTGAFAALAVLDEAPARLTPPASAPDPGLALWIDRDAPTLTALRFDVRAADSPLDRPLLVDDALDVAPDRLPGPGVVAFDPATGLLLGPGASAFVTDRTYADVTIDVDAPTGEPALVVLRDEAGGELVVGGESCPGAASATATSLEVTRRGSSVRWMATGAGAATCAAGLRPDARISVGLRAATSAIRSVARNLRIARLGPL